MRFFTSRFAKATRDKSFRMTNQAPAGAGAPALQGIAAEDGGVMGGLAGTAVSAVGA